MAILTIDKQYQDGTILTEEQLDAAFASITTLINVTGLGADNIQDGSIGPNELATSAVSNTKLATNSVSTAKIQDNAITKVKLAVAVQDLLVPTGSINAYGADVAPAGWLVCDGTQVSRAVYADLFAIIGVRFGSGDGTTTFHLPDFRGRFLRMVDGSANRDPDSGSRTAMNAGGTTGNNVGSVQGDMIGQHQHTYINPFKYNNGENGSGIGYRGTDDNTNLTTAGGPNIGNETRPKNAYVNYIIKI